MIRFYEATAFPAIDAIRIARWYIASRPDVKRAAMRVGGVDEVVSEAMFRILRHQDALSRFSLSTCVVRQVKWAIARMSDECRRRSDNHVSLEDLDSEPFYNPDQERHLISTETRKIVLVAISKLDRLDADVVTRRMGGETLESIGRRHGMSACHVFNLLLKLYQDLRRTLDMDGA